MSFSEGPNPYASPTTAPGFSPTGLSPEMSKLVRDFRSQTLALGVLWIIFALLVGGLGIFLLLGQAEPFESLAPILAVIFGAISLVWAAAGVGTFCKKSWGIYTGLVMSYIALVGNVVNLNLCGLVIIVVVLFQAHRVLGFMQKMRAAGLPLNTLP